MMADVVVATPIQIAQDRRVGREHLLLRDEGILPSTHRRSYVLHVVADLKSQNQRQT
jgi:hypothetical protein